MTRDTYIYVFIGRDCTKEEGEKFCKDAEAIYGNYYYDDVAISGCDLNNSKIMFNNYPVVLISDRWYVCEELLATFDAEHDKFKLIDWKEWKRTDDSHTLMVVSEVSF